MNVLIIGFQNKDFSEVDRRLRALIEESQVFLFNVLVTSSDSVGYNWAIKNGASVVFLQNPTLEQIIKETDYLLANYDGSANLHRLIFKYMQTGKHGSIVESVSWS